MRKLILFLHALLLALPLRLFADVRELTINFNPSDFSFIENGKDSLSILPHSSTYFFNEEISQYWPIRTFPVIVPLGSELVSINVKTNDNIFRKDINLQTPTMTWSNSLNSLLPIISTDEKSEEICGFFNSERIGNMQLIYFYVQPFIYNSVNRTLRFINRVDLALEFKSSGDVNNFTAEVPIPADILEILTNQLYDETSLKLLANLNNKVMERIRINSDIDASRRIEYLLITNEDLKEYYSELIEWKRRKGVPGRIVTVEEIYRNLPSTSKELSIKRYIHSLYSEYPTLKYVLLGGDDNVVPTAYYHCRSIPDVLPADIYYSCFQGDFDWDANGNGIRGDRYDNLSLLPSLAVTRLPVNKPQHVKDYIRKLLDYEQRPRYNHSMLMAGVDLTTKKDTIENEDGVYVIDTDEPVYPGEAAERGERISAYFMDSWDGTLRRLYPSVSDFSYSDKRIRPYILQDALGKGFSFVNVTTHGGIDSWRCQGWPNLYDLSYSDNLINNAHTIITTSACDTSWFDEGNDIDGVAPNEPCLGESFIRNLNSGVIGYLGSSRRSFYYHNSMGETDIIIASFYQTFLKPESSGYPFGLAVNHGKNSIENRVSPSRGNNEATFALCRMNPFGDPEMPVYSTFPKDISLSVVHDQGAFMMSTGLNGSRLCLMETRDNGDYRILDNISTLQIDDVPSAFYLTATAPGYIPISKLIHILQGQHINNDTIIDADMVYLGNGWTRGMPSGETRISGGKSRISASEIVLGPGTIIEKGAEIEFSVQ